ncbi:protein kinase domain-containing protein [Flavobacterium johnsoniae]|uniref:Protein kinase n=1 Tax=Flavobacterium johnsoniae (strain ATCC 17061 / DSM 2064 / JCM 8514 / BCRC 14874 / CCUG 350202 / NBRC 14942 / NCIMB 11054 / UW101) TaxID=376686 RepID=A5FDN2_FLAJ1|nr:protein kinase [Flavobacterium johnsoniae]ABQ06681.1 protein kinase [Flavobacterium johnsoniae UW101]OXE99921.1 protein kinase [Flavobacterium johnsoniae UW101]WQG82438.1 protein kinase [Flavobacterium johnsoniae UW101]SHM01320.1 Protein kinase domain-containing protein [Flavobacterium johnsoniae]
MTVKPDCAAESLEGRVLKNGWRVNKKIEPKPGSSGGFFSVCYLVSNGEKEAFLKAINFNAFFQLHAGKSIMDILNEQSAAFKFEKDLLLRCKNNKLSKVSLILDEGEEHIPDFTIPGVPYLIFEMAEGDLREHINFTKNVEIHWKLKSLHNVAVALKQLHGVGISHQDLKPSNILLYENKTVTKVGDLGRSLCMDIAAPHDNGGFTGANSYTPPEYLYGYSESNFFKKTGATDMYLLGSLIVFYFTGANMTSLIGKNLDPSFHWTAFRGSFDDIKDYLVHSFPLALKEFKKSIDKKDLAEDLAEIVKICCYPIPGKRGFPVVFSTTRNQYDFGKIVTKLDILAKKSYLKL